jgi:hypothetical protein
MTHVTWANARTLRRTLDGCRTLASVRQPQSLWDAEPEDRALSALPAGCQCPEETRPLTCANELRGALRTLRTLICGLYLARYDPQRAAYDEGPGHDPQRPCSAALRASYRSPRSRRPARSARPCTILRAPCSTARGRRRGAGRRCARSGDRDARFPRLDPRSGRGKREHDLLNDGDAGISGTRLRCLGGKPKEEAEG